MSRWSLCSLVMAATLFVGSQPATAEDLHCSPGSQGPDFELYKECCLNGTSCGHERLRSIQGWARSSSCNTIAQYLTDPSERLRIHKQGCTIEPRDPYACRGYLSEVAESFRKNLNGVDENELAIAAKLGAEACLKGLYDRRGIDHSERVCVKTAEIYETLENEEMSLTVLKFGCLTKHQEQTCTIMANRTGKSLSEEERNAVAQQQESDEQRIANFTRQLEGEKRAREEAEQRSTNTIIQGLQQLGQAAQGMGQQPSSGFNAPATAGGLAGGGSARGACSGCESQCAALTTSCKSGGQSACYRAAACLCQCNLNAGGCGTSTAALQQCVQENTRSAQQLKSP